MSNTHHTTGIVDLQRALTALAGRPVAAAFVTEDSVTVYTYPSAKRAIASIQADAELGDPEGYSSIDWSLDGTGCIRGTYNDGGVTATIVELNEEV